MADRPDFRYERISPKAYEHPADRAATSALLSIPLYGQGDQALDRSRPRTPVASDPRREFG